MKLRHGQVSIFIVIAVIVVLLGIFVFTFFGDSSFNIFADETPAFRVEEFVEVCIEDISLEAVDKIGLSSGWLYHQGGVFVDKDTPEFLVQRADGFTDPGGIEMKYWYYYDDSTESFKYNIPEYDTNDEFSLKNQLGRYVEENLNRKCVQDFESFEDVYEIDFDENELEYEVEFTNDEIIVLVTWPLNIEVPNEDTVEFIDSFRVDIDNKLRIPYYLANEITRAHAQSSFVEKRIISFMNPYQSVEDRSLLPPFYEFSLDYDYEPWDLRQVEILGKQIIASHISKIQFVNTDYDEIEVEQELQSSEFARSFANLYTKDYLSEGSQLKNDDPGIFNSFKDYKVTPYYDSYIFPTFFAISPSLGDVVLLPRPEALISLVPVFFTEYVAEYEITGPMTFQIRGSDSRNDDFVFNLVTEFNIKYNTPLAENYEVPNELAQLAAESAVGSSLICNPVQFTSNLVNLTLYDPIQDGDRDNPNDPVRGVDEAIVEFSCKGITTCFVGETSLNDNGETELSFSLPENCDPGALYISKVGYESILIDDVNPSGDQIDLGSVRMASTKEVDVDISIVDEIYDVGIDLGEDEVGFIVFEHKQTESLTRVLEINSENQYDLTIDLAPGNYSVEGFILYEGELRIPSEEICYDASPLNPFDDDECVEIPQINLSSWVRAGIEFDNFYVDENILVTKDEVVIPLRNFGKPTTFEELQESSEVIGRLSESSFAPYWG